MPCNARSLRVTRRLERLSPRHPVRPSVGRVPAKSPIGSRVRDPHTSNVPTVAENRPECRLRTILFRFKFGNHNFSSGRTRGRIDRRFNFPSARRRLPHAQSLTSHGRFFSFLIPPDDDFTGIEGFVGCRANPRAPRFHWRERRVVVVDRTKKTRASRDVVIFVRHEWA